MEARWKVTEDLRLRGKKIKVAQMKKQLMQHVKVILIMLLKNTSHQIWTLFVVEDEEGIATIIYYQQTVKQIEFIQEAALPKTSKVSISIINKK